MGGGFARRGLRLSRGAVLLAAGVALLAVAPASAGAAGFEPVRKPGRFKLEQRGFAPSNFAKADALQSAGGFGGSSVGALLTDPRNTPTRTLGKSTAIPAVPERTGYRWSVPDSRTTHWYPQGFSGSSDASSTGVVDGHRVHVISWYSRTKRQGARVSFVNVDSLPKASYRHVLLVRPTGGGRFARLRGLHAGGIAWIGPWLYVADTRRGIRVFDTTRIKRTPPARLRETGGYDYVLPQVGAYRNVGRGLLYSFLGVDRSLGRLTLLAGQYGNRPGRSLARWPVNPASNLLASERAGRAWRMPTAQIQGALSLNGSLLGSSARTSSGRLDVGLPGKPIRALPWGVSPEDLYYANLARRVWSLTERPGRRVMFAVRANKLGL